MAFMKQLPRDRLAETEVVFVAEFEHPANGFLSVRRLGNWGVLGRRQSIVFDDGLEISCKAIPLACAFARRPASISGLNVRVTVTASSALSV